MVNPAYSDADLAYGDFTPNVLGSDPGALSYQLTMTDRQDGRVFTSTLQVRPHYRFENWTDVRRYRVVTGERYALRSAFLNAGERIRFTVQHQYSTSLTTSSTVETSLSVGKEEVASSGLKSALEVSRTATSSLTVGSEQEIIADRGAGYYTLWLEPTADLYEGKADQWSKLGRIGLPQADHYYIDARSLAWATRVEFSVAGG